MSRPPWDEYFMEIAEKVAERSTCLRRKVGAILVKDKRILGTGYNGAPKGLVHCEETGCLREKLKIPSGERHELCRAIHAEMNALQQASVDVGGATLYTLAQPCIMCTKLLINAGIGKIVTRADYPDKMAVEMLREAGIEVVRLGGNK